MTDDAQWAAFYREINRMEREARGGKRRAPRPLEGIAPPPAALQIADAGIPLDQIQDDPMRLANAEALAREDAARAGLTRRFDQSLAPMGLGQIAAPFTNMAVDPERRQSALRGINAGAQVLSDVGQYVTGYVGGGQAAEDLGQVAQGAPQAIANIPGSIREGTPRAVQGAGNLISQGYDWVSNQADPEAFDEPNFIGGAGTLAVRYGPEIARSITYGPWENEAALQGELDLARARRERGLDVDPLAEDQAADAANAEAGWAGLNLAFAPADVPAAIRGAAEVARPAVNAARAVGENRVARILGDEARQAFIPWNGGYWAGHGVGAGAGGAYGYLSSDAPDVQGRLADAAAPATAGYIAGGPLGGIAAIAPRLPRIAARIAQEAPLRAERAAGEIRPAPIDVPFEATDAPAEAVAREPQNVGEDVLQKLRPLRTPGERADWAGEAIVHQPPDAMGGYDAYGFRGPRDSQFAVKIENVRQHGVPFAEVSFEDIGRSNAYEPYQAQHRFTGTEARQILNRVVAAIEEDARVNARPRYRIAPATPEHEAVYEAMARSIRPPDGYRVERGAPRPSDGLDLAPIYLVRETDAERSAHRLQSVGEDQFFPEAIRNMPLLEAAPLAIGAGGAAAAGADYLDNGQLDGLGEAGLAAMALGPIGRIRGARGAGERIARETGEARLGEQGLNPDPLRNATEQGTRPQPRTGAIRRIDPLIAGLAVGGGALAGGALLSGEAGAQEVEGGLPLEETRARVSDLENDLETFSNVDASDPDSVRRAQQALQARGLYVAADGRLGPETAGAIREHRQQVNAELESARARLEELEQQEASRVTRAGPLHEALREFGPAVAPFAGLAAGHLSRIGAVRSASRRLAERNLEADALLPPSPAPVRRGGTAEPARRMANVNEFWRMGGADERVPYARAQTELGFKRRPDAASGSELFPPDAERFRFNDAAIPAAFGAEAGVTYAFLQDAEQELTEAQAAADSDPNEANLARLESARDKVAILTTAFRAGLGVAAGRLSGVAAHRYRHARPNVPRAENERTLLDQYLAGRPRRPK